MCKRTLGAILLIVGLCVFAGGAYISHQIAQGEAQISQAEEDQMGRRRPVLGPVRRNARADVQEANQAKMGNAMQRLESSRVTANWLHGTGIVLFIAGLGCLIFHFSRKRRG